MAVFNDLLGAASGLYSISGAFPQTSLVTAGAQNLSDLLAAAAGMDELTREHNYGRQMAFAGAAPSPAVNPQMQALLQQAMAQRMVQGGLMVNQTTPTKAREFPLGFESPAAVAPGAGVSVAAGAAVGV